MSSVELSPSVLPFLGRGIRRSGPRAPWLAGSLEPGLAASRRGRLRVIYESPFRALSLSASSLRGRGFCRGDPRAPRLAGSFQPAWLGRFPPRTPSRPSCELFRALTSGLFVARPKLLPPGHARPATGWLLRAWLGGSSPLTLRVLHGELSRAPSFGLFVATPERLPRGPSRPAAGWLLRAWLGGFSPRTPSRPL